jgi:hypothetical protein
LARLQFGPKTRNIETGLGKSVAFVQDTSIASEGLADHPSQWNSRKDMASLIPDSTTTNISMSSCEPNFKYIGWRALAIIFASLSFIVDSSIDGVFVFVVEWVQLPIIDVIVVQCDPRRDRGGFT